MEDSGLTPNEIAALFTSDDVSDIGDIEDTNTDDTTEGNTDTDDGVDTQTTIDISNLNQFVISAEEAGNMTEYSKLLLISRELNDIDKMVKKAAGNGLRFIYATVSDKAKEILESKGYQISNDENTQKYLIEW